MACNAKLTAPTTRGGNEPVAPPQPEPSVPGLLLISSVHRDQPLRPLLQLVRPLSSERKGSCECPVDSELTTTGHSPERQRDGLDRAPASHPVARPGPPATSRLFASSPPHPREQGSGRSFARRACHRCRGQGSRAFCRHDRNPNPIGIRSGASLVPTTRGSNRIKPMHGPSDPICRAVPPSRRARRCVHLIRAPARRPERRAHECHRDDPTADPRRITCAGSQAQHSNPPNHGGTRRAAPTEPPTAPTHRRIEQPRRHP